MKKEKLIILEGQILHNADSEYANTASMLFQAAKDNGFDVEKVENIYNKTSTEILQKFNDGTDFYFESTFHYTGNIAGLARILAKIPESKNFYIFAHNLHEVAEKIMSVLKHDAQLANEIKQHKFFGCMPEVYDLENPKVIADLFRNIEEISVIAERAKEIEEKIAKETVIRNEKWLRAKLNPTGRRIKIKQIQAFGPQFTSLKEGDIVDELDPIILEDKTPRGVWVWGNGEPIKLLNEAGFDEFEFDYGITKNGVIEEVRKWKVSGHHINPLFRFKKEVAINDEGEEEINEVVAKSHPDEFRYEKALRILEEKEITAHIRATEILDLFDLPRRDLRHKLEKMINLNDHTFFKPRALTVDGRKTISLGF